jgi:catecholate siderophore receptor
MINKKSRRLAASSLVLALTANAAAWANETEITDVVQVKGEYLYADQVNSLKSPTPILDVPQSLSITTAEEIAERGFTSIGEIIEYTPGVNNSQGEGHRDSVVFRGSRSTADFFLDGVRDDVQYYRALYNLEQVEILRGPNALLFGRGGTGGIINRVSKKADGEASFTDYQVSIDTFGEYGLQLDHNAPLTDQAAFRFNAMYEDLDNHRDFYDGERIGLNPTLNIALSNQTTLDLSYEYSDHERFIDRGIPTASGGNGRPVEAFSDIVFGDSTQNYQTLDAHTFRAQGQHRFSENLKGRLSAFYGDYDKLYVNLYASGYDLSTPDDVTLDGYIDTTERQSLVLSADLIGEFQMGDFGHTIVTGVELIDTSNDNDRFNTFWNQTSDDNETFLIQRPLGIVGGVGVNANGITTTNDYTADPNDATDADITVFSAYIQDEIEISPMLDIVLGARFDSFEIDVTDLLSGTKRSRTDEEVSPRLGAIFKPQKNISIYASYSETFLPRSGEQFASINDTSAALDPDEFVNSEIGLKWDFADDLSFTTAIFEIEQTSPQTADSDPSTLDVIESEITGFETQLQGHLTENWWITAGYSYLDGEQVNRSGPTGLRPRELPEHMASVWNRFALNEQIGFGLGLTYQGDSFVNNSNTAVLPAYTRVDAAAYYTISDDLSLQLNIENLTDIAYFPTSHSTHQVTVGAPVNATLTLRGRF